MVFELYPESAPITTENFVKTAESGFYDGLAWCRIVEGYVIQVGLPGQRHYDGQRLAHQGRVRGEWDPQPGASPAGGHLHGPGRRLRHGGTQFFVVHKDAHKLDGRYAAFGQMTEGFEVLDAIAALPTYGPETWNKPVQMPVIREIRIVREDG